VEIVRKNFALKVLSVALALVGWAYFRLAGNPIIATPEVQQLSIPIAAVNLPLGYVARFGDHEAVVTVEGKRGESAVKPDQIKALLDLSNKGAGVYNVPVELVAPDVQVQSLSPASVTLTVERIEARSFPVGLHYVGAQPAGIVVTSSLVAPATATVRAPTSALAQVSSVRADVALPAQPRPIDEMVRPIAVDASGAEVPGLSVTPNLVRVEVRLVAGTQPGR
jgi:YbbR domain-containing protein